MKRQNCPNGHVPYIIRKGDTLKQIAEIYHSSVNSILLANPLLNPNNLQIGEQICIPLETQFYPYCPTTNYYVVKKDDTFEEISEYFRISPALLLSANFGIDPNDLYEDQILCIPVVSPPVDLFVSINERILTVYRDGHLFRSFPITINHEIPRGRFIILFKQVDPGGVLGARYLGLSEIDLGIRGEALQQFIEPFQSERSIIMSTEDIIVLFNLVTVGTIVMIG